MQYVSVLCCCTVLFDRPGIWISIVFPDRKMSGSPTPKASTRFRMFSRAWFMVP